MGQFGSVSRANWINEEGGKKVAVKTLKPTILTSKKVKFLQEAAIMGQFFHSNVIRLFGVVTVGEPVSKYNYTKSWDDGLINASNDDLLNIAGNDCHGANGTWRSIKVSLGKLSVMKS